MNQKTGIQQLIRSELVNLIVEVESDILDQAVRLYRGGKLTSEMAFASVGEVAGLRRLADKVDQGIRLGTKSGRKHGDTPSKEE